jgi:hypothetical protein
MGKRAERRHHKRRMKAKARRIYGDHPRAEHYADNMTVCSCFGCAHDRKYWGHTLQEERLHDSAKEQIEDALDRPAAHKVRWGRRLT